MNRRQFIKAAVPVVAIPAIAITCKYEDDEKGPEKESKNAWPYRVYCYEREQGEWTFSKNIRGSFWTKKTLRPLWCMPHKFTNCLTAKSI